MIDDPSQHTILVSGATGQQGGAVARHLLERGFCVRALTRSPEGAAARALADRGAVVVEGDFDDRASLDRALEGVYGAFSVQNTWVVGVDAEIRQGTAFVEAAQDAGVAHFVYSSVGGAERETGIPHFESKWQIEEHVRALDLPATILRPVAFMENWPATILQPVSFMEDWVAAFKEAIFDGRFLQPLSPDTSLQQIAVDDIGAFAALAFSDPDTWMGRAVELAGGEPTMAEMAEVFSRVLGREIAYVQVPWDAFEEQAGEEMAAQYRWYESGGYAADIEALRDVHPDLQRLEPFLRRHGWARAEAPVEKS